jgi:hypothetical protein
MSVEGNRPTSRTRLERRQLARVEVNLPGRLFIPIDGREARCKIVDMSAAGARIASDLVPETGTQVVLYIDGFGRFECDAAHIEPGHFGVNFRCSALKQQRVGEQLAVLAANGAVEATALRRHDRTATKGLAKFTCANGDVVACEVLDLSLSGLSLKTEGRPLLGDIVSIGQMSGRVVRYHETGIAIEFVNAIDKAPAESDAQRVSQAR